MIIEHLLVMWLGLYQAGYRAPESKPTPETWLEYLARAKRVVNDYKGWIR